MPRLKYIIIGDEEHLTFECIRRLALRQLSKSDELKARKHLNRCSRCKSIYDSFVIPATVKKRMSRRKTVSRVLTKVFLFFLMVGAASIFMSYEGVMDLNIEAVTKDWNIEEVTKDWNIEEVTKDWNIEEVTKDWNIEEVTELSRLYIHRLLNQSKITKLTPNPPETEISQDFIAWASPGLTTIDTKARITDKSTIKAFNKTPNKVDQMQHFDIINEGEKDQLTLRGIYGTISADGDPMKGVTVMVPGGKMAKVSDANGKYYIQISETANELLFIYQGKQLIKSLNPESSQLDIQLQMENMSYPDIEYPTAITENF